MTFLPRHSPLPPKARRSASARTRLRPVERLRATLTALCVIPALLLGMLRGAGAEPANGKPPAPARMHLFLLVGQSNMAGRGDIEPSDVAPLGNVVALNAAGEWVPAVDPLHWDKPSAGVGLGRTFAVEYSKRHPGVRVGLIPAACGGSPIASWAPGEYYEGLHSHPYDDALGRARRAMADGTLQGILWHQGESDRSPELAPRYKHALTSLIGRFRRELHAPNVPFVIGQLGRFAAAPWDESAWSVDRAQREVAAGVPFAAFVPSEGLTSKPDNLHFDARSLRELGKRYALALAALKQPAAAGRRAASPAVTP